MGFSTDRENYTGNTLYDHWSTEGTDFYVSLIGQRTEWGGTQTLTLRHHLLSTRFPCMEMMIFDYSLPLIRIAWSTRKDSVNKSNLLGN